MEIVPSALKLLATSGVPTGSSVGTPITPTTGGIDCVKIVPYSKVTTELASVVIPTKYCSFGVDTEFQTILHREFAGTVLRLPTFILKRNLPGFDGGSATAM